VIKLPLYRLAPIVSLVAVGLLTMDTALLEHIHALVLREQPAHLLDLTLSSEVARWQQIGNTRTENGPTRLATTNHSNWV
jgi:hypothetical protein